MNLDELIPDDVEIAKKAFLFDGVLTLCTGKQLKQAIREEMAKQIQDALWHHFNTEHQSPR